MPPLLEVKDLRTYFYGMDGTIKAVDGVTFDVQEGETLGLVGESGCGKSVCALSILRLIPDPPGEIVEGEICFEGQDLLKLSNEEIRQVRGNRIAMIFQEPMTSLNPVLTVGRQLAEPLEVHRNMALNEALEKAKELFFLRERIVFELSAHERVIGRKIDNAVTAEVHENHLLLSLFLCPLCLVDGARDGMVRLRRRDKPFRPREGKACGEGLELVVRPRLDESVREEPAHEGRHAVIPQVRPRGSGQARNRGRWSTWARAASSLPCHRSHRRRDPSSGSDMRSARTR